MDDSLSRASLLFIAILCLTGSLIYLKSILIPFVISLFLFFMMIPFMGYVHRKLKLPHLLGLLLACTLVFSMTAILIILALSSFESFMQDTQEYQNKLADLMVRVDELLMGIGLNLSSEINDLRSNISNLPFFNLIKGMAKGFFNFFGQSALVLIYLMFLVGGYNHDKEKSPVRTAIEEGVQKYIATKVVASTITAVCVGVAFKLIGMDLAFMFAIISFLLNFIPNIGSLIAIVFPLPVAFLQFELGVKFYLVLIIPSIIHFAIGNIIEPKVMGEGLGLHPITVLLSLMFWGMIWGAAGMLLAVPMTVCIKIIAEQFQSTKIISQFMSGA